MNFKRPCCIETVSFFTLFFSFFFEGGGVCLSGGVY